MQQPHVGESMEYADIGKVRTVVQAAACNQLLAEGWILLGPIPLLWFWIYEYPWAVGSRVLMWEPYPLAVYPSTLHTITLQ
jgi:hypothetical protein